MPALTGTEDIFLKHSEGHFEGMKEDLEKGIKISNNRSKAIRHVLLVLLNTEKSMIQILILSQSNNLARVDCTNKRRCSL